MSGMRGRRRVDVVLKAEKVGGALRIAARAAAGRGLRLTRSGVFTGRAAGDEAAERESYEGQFCKLSYFHGNSRKCGAN